MSLQLLGLLVHERSRLVSKTALTQAAPFILVIMLATVASAQTDGVQKHALEAQSIGELIATPRDEAALRPSIRVVGTVSSVGNGIAAKPLEHNSPRHFCIEDVTGGIWVQVIQAMQEGILVDSKEVLPKLQCGLRVEIFGDLDKGGFAPVVVPRSITFEGSGSLPPAERVSLRTFLRGGSALRRVTVDGVVQNLTKEDRRGYLFRIETGVGHFLTWLPKQPRYAPDRLLDAKVRVTGLAGTSRNWRAEFVCPRLIVNQHDDFVVLKAAPADPFSVDLVPIEQVDAFHPDGRPLHRRRIRGTVTFNNQQTMYVQSANTAIRIALNQSDESIQIGERVDVTGFIDTSQYQAGLSGGLIRRLQDEARIEPQPISFDEILIDHKKAKTKLSSRRDMDGRLDGRLVSIEGVLLSFQVATAPQPHRLAIDCGDSITTAYLFADSEEIRPQTKLRLTGVARLLYDAPAVNSDLAMPYQLELLLRSDDDIAVLSLPSWWTGPRALAALTLVAFISLAAFAWAFALRRALKQRTGQLSREMKDRRDAAIEFQGAMRERTRLAANLHDTLLQTMAGIAYQVEACSQPEGQDSATMNASLSTARKMIQHGQDDLRNTVWALNSLPNDEEAFPDAVRDAAQRITSGHPIEVCVRSTDDFPPLADFIAGNMLLFVREAIHNCVKHADASKVEVDMAGISGGQSVRVCVRDNGGGFDVGKRRRSKDGHFGIEGMIDRMERLGGTLVIDSRVGHGTTVTGEVPIHQFDSEIA